MKPLPSHQTKEERTYGKRKWDSLSDAERQLRIKYVEHFGDDGPPRIMYDFVQTFLNSINVPTVGLKNCRKAEECLSRLDEFLFFVATIKNLSAS